MKIAIPLLVITTLIGLAPPPASAQLQRRVTASLAGTPSSVAEELGTRFGRKVRVAPGLTGRITLTLNDAPFADALKSFVKACGGITPVEAREEGDWIIIVPIENLPKNEDVPPAFRTKVNIDARDRPIGEVTRILSRQAGISIVQDRSIPGDIRVDVISKNETFWDTVQRMAIAARLKIQIDGPRAMTLRPLPDFWAYYKDGRVGHVGEAYGTCRRCKYDLRREWRFCPMCGERIARE